MNREFITHDDDFGIRSTLKELFFKIFPKDKVPSWLQGDRNFWFDVFFNQFIPPAYYETKGTIIRHIDEIYHLMTQYRYGILWIKRREQYSAVGLNDSLWRQIKEHMVDLPTYMEIEREKQKWQQTPGYRIEEGFSSPIEEEYVQLNLHRR